MDKINTTIFLKIVETGSFRKAAEKLNYTQAGISYAVNAMEEELGINLFVREYGGVKLSSDGKAILPFIKAINNSERQLQDKINELKNLETGNVRIVTFNSAAIYWMPEIISQFRVHNPAVDIQLKVSETHQETERLILEGDADLGLFQKKPDRRIQSESIMKEPVVIAVGEGHPVLREGRFPLSDLGKYPYVRMPGDDDLDVNRLFREHRQKPVVAFETEEDYLALAMISKGIGYGIFPKLMLQEKPFGIKVMEFDEPVYRTIWLGRASEEATGKAAKAFIDFAAERIREYGLDSDK